MRTLLRAVVRSTLPEAATVVPALVRARLHGAVRSEVRARSAGARARAETLVLRVVHGAVREPVRGAADTGAARTAAATSRGDARDERGAQRRREERAAVEQTVRSNLAATVPDRQRR